MAHGLQENDMKLYEVVKQGVGDVHLAYETSADSADEALGLEFADLTAVDATFTDGETTVTEIESPNGRRAEVYVLVPPSHEAHDVGTWFIEDGYVVDGDAPTWKDAEKAAVDYAENKWWHPHTVIMFKGWVKQ